MNTIFDFMYKYLYMSEVFRNILYTNNYYSRYTKIWVRKQLILSKADKETIVIIIDYDYIDKFMERLYVLIISNLVII